jgi:hydrogenase nickel incorporation protein HypA/HybF
MHETSLIRDLMHQLQRIAEAEGAERIARVRVWLGALSHMSRAHFTEHFDEAARGTPAEGAALEVTVSEDPDDPQAQTVVLESVEVEVPEP